MLVINFKNNIPQQNHYSFSVVGNNKSNKIKFILDKYQDEVDLSEFNAFVKVSADGGDFVDLIPLAKSVVGSEIEIVWELKRKTTQFGIIDCQLSFKKTANAEDIIVWQSAIFGIELLKTIKAEEEISDKYPTILENHEERIEALEQDSSGVKDVGVSFDSQTNELNVALKDKDGETIAEDSAELPFSNYQEKLTFDDTPTEDSDNPVKSGGIKTALDLKADKIGALPKYGDIEDGTNVVNFLNTNNLWYKPFIFNYRGDCYRAIFNPTGLTTGHFEIEGIGGNTRYVGVSVNLNVSINNIISNTYRQDYELDKNKVISISPSSTDTEYPSAKCVYDSIQNFYTKLETDNKLAEKQNVIDSSHKLASDLVDDTNQTNKFVNQSEKDKINATTLAGKGITDAYTKEECDTKYVSKVNLKIDCLPPVGDSTTLSGISVQVKDAQDQVIATGTYNGTTLTFALPLNQTYKVEILTDSLTISGITYFAPEIVSGSSEGTLTNETTLTYRYSSTEHITTLSAVKQFLALPGIDLATKRLALVRTENNQFSVDIVIKNPANNTEYTMPLYILEVDNYTKLVEGVEQTFVGARVGFAYALPDSVPFDQREQVECASGETFQEGTYYYTATSTGIGDKAFTPLTAGTDYQNGDDIDTYKSTNNVFVFKHAWSNSQYGTGNKSTANLIRYGCNIFHKSNLFKWLNASGDDWFVADHLGDTISGSWFEGKKGFKDWLKSTDLALIEQDVAYGVYEIDSATLPNNKVYAQFVVPSGTEIAGSVNNNEGTVFDYWKYLNGGVIGNSANANRTVVKVSNLTSKQNTWLRSPYRGYSYYAWNVGYDGVVYGYYAYVSFAVLPLFTI